MARRRNRFASQAALEALVRFGPELSALKALQREAQSTYQQGIAQARGTARGVIAAVDEARPDVRGVYSRATAQHNALAGQVGADVGALGNVSNSIKAAIAGESGAAGSRIEESRAAALTGLSERKVAARTGQQFAVKAALRQLIGDLGKVYNRRVDLARERGAFAASTAGELRQDAADRRLRVQLERMGNTQSERNSLRSAGISPETGAPIPGGKLDPNKPPSPAEARARRKERAARVRDSRKQTQDIESASTLWRHYGSMTVEVDGRKRKPSPAEVEARLIDEGYSKRQIDIARDLIRNGGHLSSRGVAAMRELGIMVPRRWRARAYRPPASSRSDAAQR